VAERLAASEGLTLHGVTKNDAEECYLYFPDRGSEAMSAGLNSVLRTLKNRRCFSLFYDVCHQNSPRTNLLSFYISNGISF
jgi:hypothetical protein